jgi:hypothetical protein
MLKFNLYPIIRMSSVADSRLARAEAAFDQACVRVHTSVTDEERLAAREKLEVARAEYRRAVLQSAYGIDESRGINLSGGKSKKTKRRRITRN